MKEETLLLSRREAMALIGGVSYKTFAKLLENGVIPPGIPIGCRQRWTRDALLAHLNARGGQEARAAA